MSRTKRQLWLDARLLAQAQVATDIVDIDDLVEAALRCVVDEGAPQPPADKSVEARRKQGDE